MRTEVERSSTNISTASSTTKYLHGTSENYQKLSGTLDESRGLIRDLWRKNRNDMIYIFGALGIFVATVAYVILQRTPGVVWLPGKLVVRQLVNLIPKSREIVERITEIAEAALSDTDSIEDPPRLFIDTIQEKPQEEYGSDELLKETGNESKKQEFEDENKEKSGESIEKIEKLEPVVTVEPDFEPEIDIENEAKKLEIIEPETASTDKLVTESKGETSESGSDHSAIAEPTEALHETINPSPSPSPSSFSEIAEATEMIDPVAETIKTAKIEPTSVIETIESASTLISTADIIEPTAISEKTRESDSTPVTTDTETESPKKYEYSSEPELSSSETEEKVEL